MNTLNMHQITALIIEATHNAGLNVIEASIAETILSVCHGGTAPRTSSWPVATVRTKDGAVRVEVTQEMTMIADEDKFKRVIEYLIKWCIREDGRHLYDETRIYIGSDGDGHVVYSNTHDERRFVMGYIWRRDEGKYTTHS